MSKTLRRCGCPVRMHLLLGAALLLLISSALAQTSLTISDPWIRFLPGNGPLAGYFVLENVGTERVALTGATSPAFARVEAHRSVQRDGQVSMAPAESVRVPPGERVQFEPGSYHLMLMERQGDIAVGDEVAITLKFADGTTLQAKFAVKPAWEK